MSRSLHIQPSIPTPRNATDVSMLAELRAIKTVLLSLPVQLAQEFRSASAQPSVAGWQAGDGRMSNDPAAVNATAKPNLAPNPAGHTNYRNGFADGASPQKAASPLGGPSVQVPEMDSSSRAGFAPVAVHTTPQSTAALAHQIDRLTNALSQREVDVLRALQKFTQLVERQESHLQDAFRMIAMLESRMNNLRNR